MEFTAAQIAEWIGGEIIGDEKTSVSDFGKIEDAGENALTFLANNKYKSYLKDSKAKLIIISKDIIIPQDDIRARTYIKVDNAYEAMKTLLDFYNSLAPTKQGVEKYSFIHETAQIGNNIYVGAFAYIGENVKIGDNCKIYPHTYIDNNTVIGNNVTIFSGVKIYSNTVIGNDCLLHSSTVIGSDGFGFQPDENGVYHKVQQVGNVEIGNNVEIGAGCTIDRATMGSTIIEEGVKLDNQIQIGHNVTIGKNTVIAAQTGIAGSTKIGQNNMIGGQVGVAGHLKIGDFVSIQAQSGINKNISDNSKLYGSPAMDATEFRKAYVYFRKLPALMNKLNQLDKKFNKDN